MLIEVSDLLIDSWACRSDRVIESTATTLSIDLLIDCLMAGDLNPSFDKDWLAGWSHCFLVGLIYSF